MTITTSKRSRRCRGRSGSLFRGPYSFALRWRAVVTPSKSGGFVAILQTVSLRRRDPTPPSSPWPTAWRPEAQALRRIGEGGAVKTRQSRLRPPLPKSPDYGARDHARVACGAAVLQSPHQMLALKPFWRWHSPTAGRVAYRDQEGLCHTSQSASKASSLVLAFNSRGGAVSDLPSCVRWAGLRQPMNSSTLRWGTGFCDGCGVCGPRNRERASRERQEHLNRWRNRYPPRRPRQAQAESEAAAKRWDEENASLAAQPSRRRPGARVGGALTGYLTSKTRTASRSTAPWSAPSPPTELRPSRPCGWQRLAGEDGHAAQRAACRPRAESSREAGTGS